MGRKPTTNLNLPARMRARRQRSGTTYYYYDTGDRPRREIPLGPDYVMAVQKWAELESAVKAPAEITFRYAAERYMAEVVPGKAPRTQADNKAELARLLKFFDNPPAPLGSIRPVHVRQYLDLRGKTAKTRANREKALFSSIWNWARERGLTDRDNPSRGVKGFTEVGRDVLVTDTQFQAVWDAADWPTRDLMDLVYLTGQRPGDVLRMTRHDIRDGCIWVKQGKTGATLRIVIEGELALVIDRIKARDAGLKVVNTRLIRDEHGRSIGPDGLRFRFDKARKAAGQDWQIRDLRAKAATDTSDATDILNARKQLGHTSVKMTERYVRARAGEKVKPTK